MDAKQHRRWSPQDTAPSMLRARTAAVEGHGLALPHSRLPDTTAAPDALRRPFGDRPEGAADIRRRRPLAVPPLYGYPKGGALRAPQSCHMAR
jgi:hypothetical protein